MKVTFITQYFPPEVGAAASRIFDLTQELMKRKHRITVLSEYPHYPSNFVDRKYRDSLFVKENYQSISVIRSYVYVSERKNFFQRTFLYISFMLSSIIGSKHIPDTEVVIATSPPPTVGVAGWLMSRIKHSKFILDVRDLWPESVLALGAIRKGPVYSILKRIEIFLYQKADIITIAIPGFRKHITQLGISDRKIVDLPNGANIDFFYKRKTNIRKQFGLENKFIVLFSGNHGLAQGLGSILKAANHLTDFKDICFLMIGDGVEKKKIVKWKNKMKSDNVIMLDKQPREAMPDFISSADVCLVPLIKHPLFLHALPSKMFEYMACEKPIIVSIDGEAKRLIEQSGAGIFVAPEDVEQIKKAILQLYQNKKIALEMGEKGRKYVERYFNRKKLAEHFEGILHTFQL